MFGFVFGRCNCVVLRYGGDKSDPNEGESCSEPSVIVMEMSMGNDGMRNRIIIL